MLTVGIADAEAIVAEICVDLSAGVAADCVPVLASAWGCCAASAAHTLIFSQITTPII